MRSEYTSLHRILYLPYSMNQIMAKILQYWRYGVACIKKGICCHYWLSLVSTEVLLSLRVLIHSRREIDSMSKAGVVLTLFILVPRNLVALSYANIMFECSSCHIQWLLHTVTSYCTCTITFQLAKPQCRRISDGLKVLAWTEVAEWQHILLQELTINIS